MLRARLALTGRLGPVDQRGFVPAVDRRTTALDDGSVTCRPSATLINGTGQLHWRGAARRATIWTSEHSTVLEEERTGDRRDSATVPTLLLALPASRAAQGPIPLAVLGKIYKYLCGAPEANAATQTTQRLVNDTAPALRNAALSDRRTVVVEWRSTLCCGSHRC